MLLLLIALACKEGADDSDFRDDDADGYPAESDCDDQRASVYPGAEEICDNLDNDCDGEADNNASNAATYHADADGDSYGDPGVPQLACSAPSGFVPNDGDCDDARAEVHPGAEEICDGLDNDCDGQADVGATDAPTLYQDTDDDGFGDPRAPITACPGVSGLVDNSADCDDGRAVVYPEAPELCDDLDNDCDRDIDEGVLGSGAGCPIPTCHDLAGQGLPDGLYYIDPDGDFTGTLAACDLSTDGGGWTLIAWTGDSASAGVPYPGLAVCASLDCPRGSLAEAGVLDPLLHASGEIAVASSSATTASFQYLSGHDAVGDYDYRTLDHFALASSGEAQFCDTKGFATGSFRALVGASDHDGEAVYLATGFRNNAFGDEFNNFDEAEPYIWSPGTADRFCAPPSQAPGSWLGSFGAEFGPFAAGGGARSVWVR